MFRDRRDAGRQLAVALESYRGEPDVIVVGLPRGGVPVAREVAAALAAPLDVIIVRKLGVPSQPELAMGAVGEAGARVIDDDLVRRAGVSRDRLAAVERRERQEVEVRARRFRPGRRSHALSGRVVIVVDDGVATGSTARAACAVARAAGAARVVLAVPVAPIGWESRMGAAADEYVAVETPRRFGAVGNFYRDFTQTTDEEVIDLLRSAADEGGGSGPSADRG